MSRTRVGRLLLPVAATTLMFLSVVTSGGGTYAHAQPSPTVAGISIPNDPAPPKQTAADQQNLQRKIAAANAFAIQPKAVSPYCIVTPSGGCAFPVSVGGQWITEPADEFNWCGPGAGTAAFLHWNANAVNGHPSITVTNNAGGQSTYNNGQAWMADFAAHMYINSAFPQGVMNRPYSNGTNASTLVAGLDDVVRPILGWNYYAYYNPTSQNDMMSKVQADIGHDGHPMVYLLDSRYLPSWNTSNDVNHFVEGYGYESTSLYDVYYADSYQGPNNQVGDQWSSQSQMWTAVSHTHTSSGGTIAVIIW